MEETHSNAPVSAQAEVDITADVREVWTVIADIGSWPAWNPTVREARFAGELEVGARFRFSTELGYFRCRLLEVDAPRVLAWRGRLFGLAQEQHWRVEQRTDGTHVSVWSTMSGVGAWLFRGRFGRRLPAELEALVHLLKLEAETRAAHRSQAAERAATTTRGERAGE